jgi:hypothetical protein
MRQSTLLLALFAALAASAARAGDAPGVPDVPLPFNPALGAAAGDWARYRLSDPGEIEEARRAGRPPESLPFEIYAVRSVDEKSISIADSAGKLHVYSRDPASTSALAFLRGFFGEDGKALLSGLRSLSASADPIEVGGQRHDGAVRIDATLVVDPQGGHTAQFRIWVAPGVKAGGLLKATAEIVVDKRRHGGILELDGQGVAGEPPLPKKEKPGGAAPEPPTGTAGRGPR